jgi:2-polyprenyl-3-methyl-5-hydroxy-6-metoxy-1,4-benzoquinol methylase
LGSNLKSCWCGNRDLVVFSPDYLRCNHCNTLVTNYDVDPAISEVKVRETGEEEGFYNREYWFSHQNQDLAAYDLPNRARRDLPERDTYWVGCLLKQRLPPQRVLEIGCAHGGFVAIMRWAGFDATGMELSPWIVEWVQQTFDVPAIAGLVEEQTFAPGSFDVIVLMDVLEHLINPVATMRSCVELLAPDGLLMIQTPDYNPAKSYEEMIAQNDIFQKMFVPNEHTFLFTQQSIQQMLGSVGLSYFRFMTPMASHDMLLFAAKSEYTEYSAEQISSMLLQTPSGRMVQALLDKDSQFRNLVAHLEAKNQAALQTKQNLQQQLAAREKEVRDLYAWIENKNRVVDEAITSLQNHLAIKEKELALLYASQATKHNKGATAEQ